MDAKRPLDIASHPSFAIPNEYDWIERKTMTQVGEIRNKLSEFWHANLHLIQEEENLGFADADRYDAFCASKDWLQDTSDVFHYHRARNFSSNPMQAYLEFWGILQAAFVQQDAITELYYSLTGNKIIPKKFVRVEWTKLRNLRNLAVGHPNRKDLPKSSPLQRCVTGRQPKSYQSIDLAIYCDGTNVYKTLKLGDLLDRYDQEAACIMRECVRLIRKQIE